MLAQTRRLGRLVSQLLDLSRLEAGDQPFDIRPFGVREVLEGAAREARLHAPEDVVFSIDAPAELRAAGDPERIHQVVMNLVENAVRYSPRPGEIALRASSTDGHTITVEVDDEGPGIPEDDLATRLRALLPRRRAPRRAMAVAPGSASRSRAGSSSCTAARSAPSAATRTAATWSSRCPRRGRDRRTGRRAARGVRGRGRARTRRADSPSPRSARARSRRCCCRAHPPVSATSSSRSRSPRRAPSCVRVPGRPQGRTRSRGPGATRSQSALLGGLALALASAAAFRDAGWVVGGELAGAVVLGAIAVRAPHGWRATVGRRARAAARAVGPVARRRRGAERAAARHDRPPARSPSGAGC